MTASQLFRQRGFGSNGASVQPLGKPASAFPGRIAADADLAIAVNRQQTQLALPMGASDTSMTVVDPTVIVANCLLSIDSEIVQATAAPSGGVVPVKRGFDGTTPAIHLASATVSGFIDAYHHNALVAEIEAIEQTLGANLSKIPAAPFLVSSAYDFSPQSPGGNLIAGANVITLSPVPNGVNGGDAHHYLYISGGTGTAEAALIVGGTAISGAASGTVIVNCANTHSGAWTIQTATAGIQEAVIAGGANCAVRIPAGIHPVYAPFTVTAEGVSVRGFGYRGAQLNMMNPAQPTAVWDNTAGASASDIDFGDLAINYPTLGTSGGTGLTVIGGANYINNGLISNLWIQNPYIGISCTDCATMHVQSITILWPVNTGFTASNPHVVGSFEVAGVFIVFTTQTAGVGIDLYGTQAGSTYSDLFLQNGTNCFRLNGTTATPINEVQISNFIFDSYGQCGFQILLTNASASSDRVSLRNGIISSLSSANMGIQLSATTNGNIANVSISDVDIYFNNTSGIYVASTVNLTLQGVNVRCGNAVGNAIDFTAPGSNGTSITGCQLGLDSSGNRTGASVAQRAIMIEAQQHSNIYIDGCVLAGSLQRINNNSTDLTTIQVTSNNQNLDINTIASAAAVPIPAFPFFVLSGTAAVTSVTGLDLAHAGRSGMFIATGSPPGAWTGGGTIGNTFTPTQNVPVSWYWDGTKFYGKP